MATNPDGTLSRTPRGTGGFTLLELLVVVVIVSVVAAIVVPKVIASMGDTRVAALDANLALLRSAIGRYHQQHGSYPGARPASGGGCSARAGTGTIDDADARALSMAEQLTLYSAKGGKTCSLGDGGYKYGPYIKAAALGSAGIPVNPITGSNTVRVVTAGSLDLASSSRTGGWLYDVVTGKLLADHQDFDHR